MIYLTDKCANYLTRQVYKATQSAGKEVKDAKLFENANNWLESRR